MTGPHRKSDGYPMREVRVLVSVGVRVAVLDDGDGAVIQRAETIAARAVSNALALCVHRDREDEGIVQADMPAARAP